MTDTKKTETNALREALIKSGALRPKPADFLVDESGGKPFPKYRTTAMQDAAYFLEGDDK